MKTFLVSAGLIAGSFSGLTLQTLPTMAAEPEACEGSTYYCEQFAYNCTLNNGVLVNQAQPGQNQVIYVCELPVGVSVDLFSNNIAGTFTTPFGNDEDDHRESDNGYVEPDDTPPAYEPPDD